MKFTETNRRTGTILIVMDDKFRSGRFTYGIRLDEEGRMSFVGDFPSYKEAEKAGRMALKDGRR